MSTVFRDESENVRREAEDRLKRALTEAALHLESEIAIRTPVDTGRLRASISHIAPLGRSEEGGGRLSGPGAVNAAYVGTNVAYAPYVEFGTRYMAAQPYMRTGYAAAKPAMDRIIRGRLNLES